MSKSCHLGFLPLAVTQHLNIRAGLRSSTGPVHNTDPVGYFSSSMLTFGFYVTVRAWDGPVCSGRLCETIYTWRWAIWSSGSKWRDLRTLGVYSVPPTRLWYRPIHACIFLLSIDAAGSFRLISSLHTSAPSCLFVLKLCVLLQCVRFTHPT
jgi:hypothetical protein